MSGGRGPAASGGRGGRPPSGRSGERRYTVSEIAKPALSRSTVDRAAIRRLDDAWLADTWADPRTRVLLVEDGRTLVDAGDVAARLVFFSPDEAPEGERYLLGVDDATGAAYFAVSAELPDIEGGARPSGLRGIGALLNDRDAGLMVHAAALQLWHARHTHCPRCGTPTRVTAAGHVRVCPRDGSEHFPRVDPAVIMLVHDGNERCLLGRQPSWPQGRFSTLAGFVEPGESLEQAVAREVAEEVGIPIVGTRYMGSQPWPFPSNLMLGFFAEAGNDQIAVDAEEIAEARWFTRDELRSATEAGSVGLPGVVSIARRLIEGWYSDSLPGSW
ncbi:MAG: NAD(+) diphosphatase [Streptosporangiales bacterium]|nr:NAD(+) diphosphatase [Streptosporangiales bacterium]